MVKKKRKSTEFIGTTDQLFAVRVREVLAEVGDLLIAKNKSYGDQALNPVPVFSRASAEECIRARIDEKIARIRNAPGAFGDNDIMDLLGCLVLLELAKQDKAAAS